MTKSYNESENRASLLSEPHSESAGESVVRAASTTLTLTALTILTSVRGCLEKFCAKKLEKNIFENFFTKNEKNFSQQQKALSLIFSLRENMLYILRRKSETLTDSHLRGSHRFSFYKKVRMITSFHKTRHTHNGEAHHVD